MKKLLSAILVCIFCAPLLFSELGAKSKTLVVYYSWSGNTEYVARRIAAKLNADIFEIQTVKKYPKYGHETAVISMQERNSRKLPELSGKLFRMRTTFSIRTLPCATGRKDTESSSKAIIRSADVSTQMKACKIL